MVLTFKGVFMFVKMLKTTCSQDRDDKGIAQYPKLYLKDKDYLVSDYLADLFLKGGIAKASVGDEGQKKSKKSRSRPSTSRKKSPVVENKMMDHDDVENK